MYQGLSASAKFRNSRTSAQSSYATTPGSFFHARHQRNNSLSQRTDGQVLGSPTYQTAFMATVTASVPVASKTFRNYLSTREKKLEVDKNYIEKLNESAFKKMKNEKLAEKAMEECAPGAACPSRHPARLCATPACRRIQGVPGRFR